MKSITIVILALFIWNNSFAQTKKIALRSHSGANATFTIYVPDEFGRAPIEYRERLIEQELIRKKQEEKKKKGSLSLPKMNQQRPLPKMPKDGYKIELFDTVLQACPAFDSSEVIPADSVFQTAPIQPERHKPNGKTKRTTRPDTIIALNTSPEEAAVVNRTMNFPKQEPETMEVVQASTKKGSLNLLIWLLSIPAVFSFFTYVRQA